MCIHSSPAWLVNLACILVEPMRSAFGVYSHDQCSCHALESNLETGAGFPTRGSFGGYCYTPGHSGPCKGGHTESHGIAFSPTGEIEVASQHYAAGTCASALQQVLRNQLQSLKEMS